MRHVPRRLCDFFNSGAMCSAPTLVMRRPIRGINGSAISNRDVCKQWNRCHHLGFTKPHSAARNGCRDQIQIPVHSWCVRINRHRQVCRDPCRRYRQLTIIIFPTNSYLSSGNRARVISPPASCDPPPLFGDLSGFFYPIIHHAQFKVLGSCSIQTASRRRFQRNAPRHSPRRRPRR